MKENSTELVFILDNSGSMCGLEKDTIGGFNSMIQKQTAIEDKCYVSVILFNDKQTVIYDRAPINNVKPMTQNDYIVDGCTALLDAMGNAIKHINNVHKHIRKEDVPQKTMFIITTDGMENSSHKFSSKSIKKMIKTQECEKNWEFLFLGANIDSVQAASEIGIKKERALDYVASKGGTKALYEELNQAVSEMRITGCLSDDWKDGAQTNLSK